MDGSFSAACFTQGREYFYIEFLEFARRYPEVKICLYVPQNDLPLLAKEGSSSIVCDLLTLCESGRLTLVGIMPRPHLLEYLRGIRNGKSNPIPFQEESVGGFWDSHPNTA